MFPCFQINNRHIPAIMKTYKLRKRLRCKVYNKYIIALFNHRSEWDNSFRYQILIWYNKNFIF